jgi:DHA3 family tetracycline resistance protein-like MFS transporter
VSSRPYLIYTGIETWLAFAVAVASTAAVVYRVESGHLNALELILVGTAVELVYFVFQLPTGILADLVSRRLCVVAGVFLTAAGFLGQWASASFAVFVLAQVPIGVGAALMVGAQEAWLADESGSSELTSAFLRAGQWSLGGTLVGSVLGGLLARAGLSLPYLVGGVVTGLLGVVLVMVMPENSFRPSAWHRGELRGVLRQARGTFTGQVKATRTAMVAVSGLVALLVMTFFLGMWGESFDRLWGAYLLEDIRFPHLLGLTAVTWFSVLAVCASLLSLLSTQVAKRRTDRLGPSSVAGTLLACTLVTAAAVVALGAARTFPVVIVAYLVVTTVRPPVLAADERLDGSQDRAGGPGYRALGGGPGRLGRPDPRRPGHRRHRHDRLDPRRAAGRCRRPRARRCRCCRGDRRGSGESRKSRGSYWHQRHHR